jgi:glycosyltransferase involved in cell wall biosynthesis
VPPDLSLVVPCYNEAEHLRGSVAAVREVLDQTRYDYEIVFVDDGSQDATRAIVEELCAGDQRCRYIFHERNRGRGAAVKTGFAASSGRVTGFLDIDLEVHARYVPALANLILRHGFDVAIGRRYYLLSQTGGLMRHFLSLAYRLLLKLLLDCGVRDTETGCKFFRRDTAGGAVLQSQCDGWFWDTEVMGRAALAGLRIHEMPVLFLRRLDKRSTVRVLPDSLRYLVELHRFRSKVGLSLLSKSPIYWTCVGYDLVMRLLYGRQYRDTYAAVARRIPDGASVVDVCCGTARLARDFLRGRPVSYLGLDFNGHFVMGVRKRGVPARFFNVLTDPIPPADYVVICSSLYHFRAQEDQLLEKLKAAARRAVIISEPVRNVSSSRIPLIGRAAARLSHPGVGDAGARYDRAALERLAARHGASELAHEPGQRNAIMVLPGRGGDAAVTAAADDRGDDHG